MFYVADPGLDFPFVMRRVWPAWGAQKPVVLRELSIAPLRLLVVEPRLSRSPPSCVRNPRFYVIVNKLGMDARRAPANLSHRPDESTISASTRGRPAWRRWEIFAQYLRNRSRFHRATVSAWTSPGGWPTLATSGEGRPRMPGPGPRAVGGAPSSAPSLAVAERGSPTPGRLGADTSPG